MRLADDEIGSAWRFGQVLMSIGQFLMDEPQAASLSVMTEQPDATAPQGCNESGIKWVMLFLMAVMIELVTLMLGMRQLMQQAECIRSSKHFRGTD